MQRAAEILFLLSITFLIPSCSDDEVPVHEPALVESELEESDAAIGTVEMEAIETETDSAGQDFEQTDGTNVQPDSPGDVEPTPKSRGEAPPTPPREDRTETAKVPEPVPEPMKEPEPESATKSTTAAAERGAAIFSAKCSMCHGSNGNGDTPIGRKNGIRDYASAEVQSMSDARLSEILHDGAGPVSAKAHKSKNLTDDQVHDLIAFIRSLG